MIVIEKMITHVMDPSANMIVCSDTCMEDMDAACIKLIEQKASKIFTSGQRKCGTFKEGSKIAYLLDQYRASLLSFEQMSIDMAKYIFETKMKCAQFEPSDLIIAEVVYEERRYLIGLDNAYLEQLSHVTNQVGEATHNTVETFSTLLSTTFIKRDRAFMIEFSDYAVSSVEPKVDIEAQKRYFYGDVVLACENTPSYQDAVKTITKVCEETIKEYDLKAIEVLPKMKQALKESVEDQEDIKVEEVAQAVFASVPLAKQHFQQEVKQQGVVKAIPVEHMKTSKSEKVQKIRTDKGIEIIIPVDYMNSTDYVEIQTAEDGLIHIELKNINHITSK